MALISVVELLSDPDFCDPVTVLRQIQAVGTDGIAVETAVTVPIVASIQSASGDNLSLLPDLARTEGTYEIITTFPLLTATDQTAADVIQWRGATFTVISVARFDNFAGYSGHYEGVMALNTTTRPFL